MILSEPVQSSHCYNFKSHHQGGCINRFQLPQRHSLSHLLLKHSSDDACQICWLLYNQEAWISQAEYGIPQSQFRVMRARRCLGLEGTNCWCGCNASSLQAAAFQTITVSAGHELLFIIARKMGVPFPTSTKHLTREETCLTLCRRCLTRTEHPKRKRRSSNW